PLRLKTYWCYVAPQDAPDPASPAPPPSISNGYVTFGCLNNFSKISPPALRAWSPLLRETPRSRLILPTPAASFHKSILPHIAHTPSSDTNQRTPLRPPLRNELRNSRLTDAPAIARDVESIYRQVWRSWCSGHAVDNKDARHGL